MKSRGLILLAVVVVLGICRPALAYRVTDPALGSKDPSVFRDDAWDRAAASRVDRARGTNLRALLTNPSADREVVDTLRTTKEGKGETFQGRCAARAPEVLIIRRARAAYAAAAHALRSQDANTRAWGLRTFEFVEGRKRGGGASPEPGPPYEGKERDASVLPPPTAHGSAGARRRSAWARMLRKVFEVEPFVCPRLRVEMEVVARITEAEAVERAPPGGGVRGLRPEWPIEAGAARPRTGDACLSPARAPFLPRACGGSSRPRTLEFSHASRTLCLRV